MQSEFESAQWFEFRTLVVNNMIKDSSLLRISIRCQNEWSHIFLSGADLFCVLPNCFNAQNVPIETHFSYKRWVTGRNSICSTQSSDELNRNTIKMLRLFEIVSATFVSNVGRHPTIIVIGHTAVLGVVTSICLSGVINNKYKSYYQYRKELDKSDWIAF